MAVTALKANGLAIPSTYLPKDKIAADQVRDVVMQYFTAHPDIRNLAAAGEAVWALQAAFPCK
jgi:hypothetical protein